MNALKIGKLVRKTREKKHIYRDDLAKHAKMAPISLYRLEEKGTLPRYDKMMRIKEKLGLEESF